MSRLATFALAISLFFTSPLSASQEIDIYKYLALARQNDVEIEKILHERIRTSFLKAVSLPSSAIILGVKNEYGFALGDGNRTDVWQLSAQKTFQTTGTTASVSYNINKQEDRKEDQTTITVEQQLLRNALGKQTRRLDARLSKENEAILLQTLETYEDYMSALISDFLDWQLTHLNRKLTQSLLTESQTLQKYIEQREKRNIAAAVDVGKVKLEAMGYEESSLELDVALASQLSAVATIIGTEKPGDFVPVGQLNLVSAEINFDNDMREAIKNSRMVRAYRLAQEAGAMDISIRKEELYPELNLVFGFNYDNSTRFNVSTNRKEVFVGFNLEIPIWETQKGALVKQARYEKIAATLALSQYEKNLGSSLRAQRDRIAKQKKRVELSSKKLALSENVAKDEENRYKNGKIDLETLINARQASARNRYNHLSNQIQYSKDLVEWLRLSDRLVVKDEVSLK